MTTLNEWKQTYLRIPIAAPQHSVYDAWATPAGLERWFLRRADYNDEHGGQRHQDSHITKGDHYRWMWHGHPDSVAEDGHVVDANGVDRLSFTFSGNSLVTVALVQEAGHLVVELTHSNFPPAEKPSESLQYLCSVGWTFYLANLKSILEGGIDLRNRDLTLPRVINS